jgi:hypothetical protein
VVRLLRNAPVELSRDVPALSTCLLPHRRRRVLPRASSVGVDPEAPYVPSDAKQEVQFNFACPICQQTEFKISSMPTQ